MVVTGTIYRWMLLTSLLVLCLYFPSEARQVQDTTGTDENIIQRNVEITGQFGAYGEIYSISGREGRRPNATGRLSFTPRITFLNEVSLGFNVLLSTEGISARQNISQIGINPSWGWGNAHAGDFSESFSKYTLDGITIRGGGLNLAPGDGVYRLSMVGGRSQRAVSGGAGNKSYNRTIWGALLGIGKPSGSFLDLMVVKARDDVGSLPPDSLLATRDSLTADTTVVGNVPPTNTFAVTPQENLVGGMKWRLNLIPQTLRWESEVGGSIYTRDVRSRTADVSDLDVPSVAERFFTPRFSTSADFVIDTKVNLTVSRLNLSTGYKWIGPGYTSLGTSYLINDQQAFSTRASVSLSEFTVTLNWARLNDNLLNQKRFTSVQNRYGGTVTTRFGSNWSSNVTANVITRGNDSDSDSTRSDFTNLMLSTNQNITFSNETGLQNFSINYSYQTANTETGLRFKSRTRTHTLNTQTRYRILENLNVSATVGLVSSQPSDTISILTQNYSLRAQHQLFENDLTNSLSFTTSVQEKAVSLRTRLSSTYRLTDKNSVSLSLSLRNFSSRTGTGDDFNEFIGSLRISHRF